MNNSSTIITLENKRTYLQPLTSFVSVQERYLILLSSQTSSGPFAAFMDDPDLSDEDDEDD